VYDELSSIWKEGGSALLGNKRYTGTTSNLSYLQWATPHPMSLLRAYVRDNQMNAAAGLEFNNFCNRFNSIAAQMSPISDKGIALVYIPASKNGRASIFTHCGEILGFFNVSPIGTGGTSNQTFILDLSSIVSTITGTVENCNFSPVIGRIELLMDGSRYKSDLKDGVYKIGLMSCKSSSGVLSVFDSQNKLLKQITGFSFTKGTTYKAPPISMCETAITGSISVKAEGVTYIFQSPQDKIEFVHLPDASGQIINGISASSTARGQSFYITYKGTELGIIPIYTLSLSVPNKNYFLTWGYFAPGNVNISKYKTGSTLSIGTFQSKTHLNFGSGNSPIIELTGTFNITR
jgi:hypothetical protein